MTMKRPAVILVALAVINGITARALAAPGELDSTFGDNGFARVEMPNRNDRATAIYVQSDGKLLVGGGGDFATDDFAVLRLNADGSLDSTFGAAGATAQNVSAFWGRTSSLIELADGSIVAAGTAAADTALGRITDLAIARYLADGRVDSSFGDRGVSRAGFGDASIESVAVVQQSGGKLVAAGTGSDGCAACWGYEDGAAALSAMVLARFDTVGVLDPGFGTSGRVVLAPSTGPNGIRWLAQQADGKLVAAGFSGPDMAIVRLTADGAADPSFDGDGLVTLPGYVPGADARADVVAVQGDGKIVIAGTVSACEIDDADCIAGAAAIVARLNVDGSVDATFGFGGRTTVDIRGWGHIEAARGGLVTEPDGAIVIAGRAGLGSAERSDARYGFVARLTSSGELDTGFGDEGVTLLDVGRYWSPPAAAASGLARASSGAIAVAMTNRNDPTSVIARLTRAGASPGVLGLVQVAVGAPEGTDAQFVVRRTGGASGAVGIDYWTYVCWDWGGGCNDDADERDYDATSGTLTWPDGDTSDRTVAIPILADDLFENAETFSFDLGNATGGVSVATSHGWVVIADVNDNPGTLQFVAGGTAREGTASVAVWVGRTNGRTGALTVDYFTTPITASASLDFTATTGTLYWADGDVGIKTITIPIVNDGLAEGEETFQVTLSAPSGGASLGSTSTAIVTIYDPWARINEGGGGSSGVLDALLLALLFLASLAFCVTHRCRGSKEPDFSSYTNKGEPS